MSFSKAIGTVMSSAPSSESSISYSRLSQAAPSEKGTGNLRTMGIGLITGLEFIQWSKTSDAWWREVFFGWAGGHRCGWRTVRTTEVKSFDGGHRYGWHRGLVLRLGPGQSYIVIDSGGAILCNGRVT